METLRLPHSPADVARRWASIGSGPARVEISDERAIDDAPIYAHNVENYLGCARVPIGIAGPLHLTGAFARGAYRIPLATTEATLVASYHRGMRVIRSAGGANAALLDERIERTPAFVVANLTSAVALADWIRASRAELGAIAESTSRHARCLDIAPLVEGNHVYLACAFTTGEAAGQNMVTIATAAICAAIRAQSPIAIRRHVVEANLSGDKKATARSLAGTRGKRVSADVTIPRRMLHAELRVWPEELAAYWRIGAVGAALSGAIGIAGHFANGLTALAIALGGDAACVAESAVGITRYEVDERGDLYACVTLPNIITATVGGGTALPTQRAALDILARGGPICARALGEITAGVLLAGELSIAAAICAGEFAAAHQRFARRGVAAC
jgi:hydroxymethylglutaryl-CoA reductase (NADPH)